MFCSLSPKIELNAHFLTQLAVWSTSSCVGTEFIVPKVSVVAVNVVALDVQPSPVAVQRDLGLDWKWDFWHLSFERLWFFLPSWQFPPWEHSWIFIFRSTFSFWSPGDWQRTEPKMKRKESTMLIIVLTGSFDLLNASYSISLSAALDVKQTWILSTSPASFEQMTHHTHCHQDGWILSQLCICGEMVEVNWCRNLEER